MALSGSKTWKTATFDLKDAIFSGAQNVGSDFRLTITAAEFHSRKVEVVRPGLNAEACSNDMGFKLSLFGPSDAHYRLEQSTDLKNWRQITALRSQPDGNQFIDLAARDTPHGWYRAHPVSRLAQPF